MTKAVSGNSEKENEDGEEGKEEKVERTGLGRLITT
jgi:hypothetical protein